MTSAVRRVRNAERLKGGVKDEGVRKRLRSPRRTATDETSIDGHQAKTTESTHTWTCAHTILIHEDFANVLSESIKQRSKHRAKYN